MDPLLDFEECVRDSPDFRRKLQLFEADVSELETHLEKVMKLCGRMVEAGQAYSAANQLFLSSLTQLSVFQEKHGVVTACLNQFSQGLQEMVGFHTMLFDQMQRAINHQLSNLCTQFLPQLAETRRDFVRIGEDLETAAAKNAQVSRHKSGEAERASHLLLATRKCFQHFALDYCLQINSFKTQQRLDILNAVFSFVHAQVTFFHQGSDLLRDLEPTMKTMAAQLSQLSTDCSAKRKELENTHLLVQQRDASGEASVGPPPGSSDALQGHLFKRSRRKSKTWKRCWFSIRDNQLLYRKTHKDEDLLLFQDLRLCAVRPLENVERRFCFELLSVQKCCVLQADSEQLKQSWLGALQGSIDLAYGDGTGRHLPQVSEVPPVSGGADSAQGPGPGPAALGVALRGPGNQVCCDCGEEEPRWASINLGITLCIECSGVHRSLGVHLSKVRSLTLDWWEPEQLKLLCILGNDVINEIYEARCPEGGRDKPRAGSRRADKERWIRQKYVHKRFVHRGGADGESTPPPQPRPSPPTSAPAQDRDVGLRLYRAALAGDLVAMATALAQGAEVNRSVSGEEGRTALIGAAVGGSLLACEFLLLNGANVNHRDLRGRGALHAAATAGHTGQVCLLLKRGANQYAADETGQDPLAIAVETAHADIVTLLRMARMNEEMRDSEGVFGSAGDDETFQDIFRDFSDMASHDPEKLSRRHFNRVGDEDETKAKHVDVTLALNSTLFLRNETDYVPWEAAVRNLRYLVLMLEHTEAYGPMQTYLRRQAEILYDHFSYYTDNLAVPLEQSSQYSQQTAVEVACSNGLPQCLEMALNVFGEWMTSNVNRIQPNLRSVIYCHAVAAGGTKEWEFAWEKFQTTNSTTEKEHLLRAMSCTTEVWLLNRYLEYCLDAEKISLVDVATVISAVAENVVGYKLAWNFIRQHWEYIKGGEVMAVIKSVTSRMSKQIELEELERFATEQDPVSSWMMTQVIEQIRVNIQWVNEHKNVVLDWLEKQT